jgi:hypothetical protein
MRVSPPPPSAAAGKIAVSGFFQVGNYFAGFSILDKGSWRNLDYEVGGVFAVL